MAIAQEQLNAQAIRQIGLLRKDFGADSLSTMLIQDLFELVPCRLQVTVQDALWWYVGPDLDEIYMQFPESEPNDLELVNFILERQPELQNVKGVLEHVIGLAHKREYPYPIDADLVKSMLGEDLSVVEQTDELQIIKTKKKKKKKRSKH